MGIEAEACIAHIDRLRERGDLDEIGAYLVAIDAWKNAENGSPESVVYACTMVTFAGLVKRRLKQINTHIDQGQWLSVDCKRLHAALQRVHPMFVDYDENTYARLRDSGEALAPEDDEPGLEREWSQRTVNPKPSKDDDVVDDDIDLDDDLGDYSDDSDDEFDAEDLEVYADPRNLAVQDAGFPESDRPPKSTKKKRWLSRRSKKEQQLRPRNKRAQKVREARANNKITFRYSGTEVEPPPRQIATRVHLTREEFRSGEEQQIAMASIRHGPDEWTPQVEQDFAAAKIAFAAGDIEALRGLETQFCIAQYRGITYKTSIFDSRMRQVSRNENELGRAIYSMSVLIEGGVSPSDYFQGNCSDEELAKLDEIAVALKAVLLAKRNTEEVEIDGIRFNNHADAIQHIYTTKYEYFHSAAGRYVAHSEEWKKDRDEEIPKLRKESRSSEEAYKRTDSPVNEEHFRNVVTSIQGLGADYPSYARYLNAANLAADEQSYKQAFDAKAFLSPHGRDKHYAYAMSNTGAVMTFTDFTALLGEYGAYPLSRDGYTAYIDDVVARTEQDLDTLADEVEAAYLQDKYGFIPPDNWDIFEGFLNGYCPLVSTADNPRHALKYAYGMKFYGGHYHERLKPGWDTEGRARRPYIGKVYTSLHTLEEYLEDSPNHVPSMNLFAKIIVGDMVAEEREATFPAYIPGARTIIEHIAKIPSFRGKKPGDGHRQAHLYKYGIDLDMFGELHAELRRAQDMDAEAVERAAAEKLKKNKKPGKDSEQPAADTKVDSFLQSLCAWLVNYQEVRLIEVARRLALTRNHLLVYRNSQGELARDLTSIQLNGVRLPGDRGLDSQDPMELRTLRRYDGSSAPKNERKVINRQRASWVKPQRTFRSRLEDTYTIHPTLADGNCLFHTLAAIVKHEQNYHPGHIGIRRELVHYMRSNAAHGIRQQHNLNPAYLAEMMEVCVAPGQISRWGGDSEIHAFCWHFGVRARVYSPAYPGPEHYTEFGPRVGQVPRYTAYLLHVHGNHWEYLRLNAVGVGVGVGDGDGEDGDGDQSGDDNGHQDERI